MTLQARAEPAPSEVGLAVENHAPKWSARRELTRGAPVLLTTALGSALGMAGLPVFTLPLFIGPLHEAFGWPRSEIGAAFTILALVIFFGSPLVGRLADRVGARKIVLVSIVLFVVSMFGVSQLQGSIWMFYACYLAIGISGAGTTYVCYSRVLSTWFRDHRGLALGLMMSGPGLVAGLGPLVLTPLIAEQGWRHAWLLMSFAAMLAWPLAWLFLRDGPVAGGTAAVAGGTTAGHHAGLPFAHVRRSRIFWCMVVAVFTVTLAATGTHIHLIAITTGMGLSPAKAAGAASALGLSMLAGRLISGMLIDRIFAPIVGCTLTLVAALAMLGSAAFGLPPLFMAIGIGVVFGMESDFMAYVIVRYFGLRAYAETFGWIFGFMALGSASSPLWVGWLHTRTGSYEAGLFVSAGLLLVSAACIAALGRYPTSIAAPGAATGVKG